MGLPKGVMLTQRNIVANLLQSDIVADTPVPGELMWNGGINGEGDSLLGVLPFYHVYGKIFAFHKTLLNLI